jgi:hypothetical protein
MSTTPQARRQCSSSGLSPVESLRVLHNAHAAQWLSTLRRDAGRLSYQGTIEISSGGGTRTHNLTINSRSRCHCATPDRATPEDRCRPGSFYDTLCFTSSETTIDQLEGSTVNPASTSAWQFEHSSTHFSLSARSLTRLRAPRCANPNSLAAGSR